MTTPAPNSDEEAAGFSDETVQLLLVTIGLGPFIGIGVPVAMIFLYPSHPSQNPTNWEIIPSAIVMMIGLAFVGGLIPASLHSMIMLAIARRIKSRFALFVISPVSGYVATTLYWAVLIAGLSSSTLSSPLHPWDWWVKISPFGLLGIVPAIVCSLIIEALRWRRRRKNIQMHMATGS